MLMLKKLAVVGITVFLIILLLNYATSKKYGYSKMQFTDITNKEYINDKNDSIFEIEELISLDSNSSTLPPSILQNETKLLFDHCELEDLDPWHPSLQQFLDPLSNSMKNCRPRTKQISKLENGQLFLFFQEQNEDNECKRRCLLPDSDDSLIFGEWIAIQNGTRPECDIFEIECFEIVNGTASKNPFYKFLHSQIYRPNLQNETEKKDNNDKPDVHIIVLDSVSESQFVRSMPKTRHLLREYYEAISFRHLNKIGINSLPNGFALLLGKQVYPIAKSGLSQGYESDYVNESYCSGYLDGDQFIGFRFQDAGYKTMMSEDWALGVFNWPDCKGFKTKPTDHYMRPFQLRVEGNKWRVPDLSSIIFQGLCRETYQYNMDYLQNFIDAYPDKPKFSLSWMSYLAHDDDNALYHTDDYFYKFFKENIEKFNNSFIFFMGDHGHRYGDIRDNTHDGEAEDNNPFLFLSVPASLRKNLSIVDNIRQNAKSLISHYDIYATLTKITNPQNPHISNPMIKGSSLFKPLPHPRSCDRLHIPFEHCLCSAKRHTLPEKNEIAIPGAEYMVTEMNKILQSFPELSVCSSLTLDLNSPIVVEEYEEKSDVIIFKITFFTMPGGGKFWGVFTQNIGNGTLNILSERLGRINAHAQQSSCALLSRYAHYCYCKNLLKGK